MTLRKDARLSGGRVCSDVLEVLHVVCGQRQILVEFYCMSRKPRLTVLCKKQFGALRWFKATASAEVNFIVRYTYEGALRRWSGSNHYATTVISQANFSSIFSKHYHWTSFPIEKTSKYHFSVRNAKSVASAVTCCAEWFCRAGWCRAYSLKLDPIFFCLSILGQMYRLCWWDAFFDAQVIFWSCLPQWLFWSAAPELFLQIQYFRELILLQTEDAQNVGAGNFCKRGSFCSFTVKLDKYLSRTVCSIKKLVKNKPQFNTDVNTNVVDVFGRLWAQTQLASTVKAEYQEQLLKARSTQDQN